MDYALVHADDAYLDALSAGELPPDFDLLAVWLLDWRNAVDAKPIYELLVTTDEAVATVHTARTKPECA